MLWSKKRNDTSAPQGIAHATPEEDLEAFNAVHRANHIAYVPAPAASFSGVPGVGTGNMVYLPDFLLSAPAFFGGNAMLRVPNAIMLAQTPAMVTLPKTSIEGVGGLQAGQMVHQPLLSINVNNGQSEVGE